jgi:hypothetical protein
MDGKDFDLRIIILQKKTEKSSWNISSRKKGDGKKEQQTIYLYYILSFK